MFKLIHELSEIRQKRIELCAKERELTRPKKKDIRLIDKYYEEFLVLSSGRIHPKDQRCVFILIVCYFFSPMTLAGGKLRNGIREKLCLLFNIKSVTQISEMLNNSIFMYRKMPSLRNNVDFYIQELAKKFD